MRTLGTALKKRRDQLGITQAQAAEHFDVERQAYSIWERGARATLDADFLGQLAGFLGTDAKGALVAIGWLEDEDGTGTVAGPSPRWANRQNDATYYASVHPLPVAN